MTPTANPDPQLGRQPWNRTDLLVLGGLAATGAVAIALGFAGLTRVQPVAGLALILALAYCLSSARVAITRSSTPPVSVAMSLATGAMTFSGSFVRLTTPKSIST